jgi:excisionase family DNA binding protein
MGRVVRIVVRPKAHDAPMDVWSSLEREWTKAGAGRSAERSLDAWAASAPALTGYASPAAVVAIIGRVGDPERSCALLSDLLFVAGRNDLAALAVLRAILPGVRRAAGRRWRTGRDGGAWRSREEIDGDAVAAAWEAIHRHAGERHDRPARVIVRRVERCLRTTHDAHRRAIERSVPLLSEPAVGAVEGCDDWMSTESVALTLVDAVQSGYLDRLTAALLFAVAVLGWNLSDAGRLLGLNRGAVYRCLSDARRVLGDGPRASPRQAAVRHRFELRIRNLSKENFPMVPLLLTVKEAADMIGIGRTTLYDLMDTGEVYSVRRGASRRIPLWAVYDYVDRLCHGRFHHVPLPAVLDLLVRLADEHGGPDVRDSRHRPLLHLEGGDRSDGGAVVEINTQHHPSDVRHVEAPAGRGA